MGASTVGIVSRMLRLGAAQRGVLILTALGAVLLALPRAEAGHRKPAAAASKPAAPHHKPPAVPSGPEQNKKPTAPTSGTPRPPAPPVLVAGGDVAKSNHHPLHLTACQSKAVACVCRDAAPTGTAVASRPVLHGSGLHRPPHWPLAPPIV